MLRYEEHAHWEPSLLSLSSDNGLDLDLDLDLDIDLDMDGGDDDDRAGFERAPPPRNGGDAYGDGARFRGGGGGAGEGEEGLGEDGMCFFDEHDGSGHNSSSSATAGGTALPHRHHPLGAVDRYSSL